MSEPASAARQGGTAALNRQNKVEIMVFSRRIDYNPTHFHLVDRTAIERGVMVCLLHLWDESQKFLLAKKLSSRLLEDESYSLFYLFSLNANICDVEYYQIITIIFG